MYLLDTNACVGILNDSAPSVVARLRLQNPSGIRLCSIVKAELLFGARHSARPAENLRVLDELFAPFVSLPFDDECAKVHARVRVDLRGSGKQIGILDSMIAATALAFDQILVTHNVREFERVPGLRIEDWESE